MIRPDIDTPVCCRDHLKESPPCVGRERDQLVILALECNTVIHIDSIASTEPDTTYLILYNAVDSGRVGSFRHGVKPIFVYICSRQQESPHYQQ